LTQKRHKFVGIIFPEIAIKEKLSFSLWDSSARAAIKNYFSIPLTTSFNNDTQFLRERRERNSGVA